MAKLNSSGGYYGIKDLVAIFDISADTIERRIKEKTFPPPIPRVTRTSRRQWPVEVIQKFKKKRDEFSENYTFCAFR